MILSPIVLSSLIHRLPILTAVRLLRHRPRMLDVVPHRLKARVRAAQHHLPEVVHTVCRESLVRYRLERRVGVQRGERVVDDVQAAHPVVEERDREAAWVRPEAHHGAAGRERRVPFKRGRIDVTAGVSCKIPWSYFSDML